MPLTTEAQKNVATYGLLRYLKLQTGNDLAVAFSAVRVCVDLMLISAAARKAVLLPHIQAIRDEHAAHQASLPTAHAAQSAAVSAAIADDDSTITNL